MNTKKINTTPGLHNFSIWLFRLMLLLYFIFNYSNRLTFLNLHSEYSWLAVIYISCSLIIFAGGFIPNSLYTQIPSLIIVVAGLVHFVGYIIKFHIFNAQYIGHLILLCIAFFLFSESGLQKSSVKD